MGPWAGSTGSREKLLDLEWQATCTVLAMSSLKATGHHQPYVSVSWRLARSTPLLGERVSYVVYFLVLRIERGVLHTLGKHSTVSYGPNPGQLFGSYRSGHADKNLS